MLQTFLFVRLGEEVVWRQEAGLHIFWKKVRESLSRLSFNEFKLATNKTLGYDRNGLENSCSENPQSSLWKTKPNRE